MLTEISNALEFTLSSETNEKNEFGKRELSDLDYLPLKLQAKLGRSSSPNFASSSSPYLHSSKSFHSEFSEPSSPVPCKESSPIKKLLLSEIESPTKLSPIRVLTVEKEDVMNISLRVGEILHFGRKIKTKSRESILISPTKKLCEIALPAKVVHASRLHCTVKLLPHPITNKPNEILRIEVLGQNGLKVKGKLFGKGEVYEQELAGKESVIKLEFWGLTVNLSLPKIKKVMITKRAVITTVPKHYIITPTVSSSQSREFSASEESESESEMEDLEIEEKEQITSVNSPAPSSPLSLPPSPSHHSNSLPPTISLDLPGLITSSIVFHPRSTVSTAEILEALRKEIGDLDSLIIGEEKIKLGEEEWLEILEGVLVKEEMFGCISNLNLFDAAGNPLPPAYYYLPEHDTDKSRSTALEPFVKRVRGTRLGGGKRYFWRRPALKKKW